MVWMVARMRNYIVIWRVIWYNATRQEETNRKMSAGEKRPNTRRLEIVPFSGDTLTSQVYEGLREQIERGEYARGDVLPSRITLARRLGVSEFVVRAAMKRLVADKLVSVRPGRGHVVETSFMKSAARALVLDVNIEPWYSFGPSVSLFECAKALRRAGCQVRTLPLGGGGNDAPYLAPLKDELSAHPDLVILRSSASRRRNAMRLVAESGCNFVTVGMGTGISRFARHVGHVFYDYSPAVAAFVEACRSSVVGRVVQLDFGRNSYLDASAALHAAGIAVERISCPTEAPCDLDELVAGAYAAMRRRLSVKPLPDVFLFTDDYLALGAREAMRDCGVNAPHDVRVVSFANRKSGLMPFDGVTHVEFDPYADGREIARCALEWLRTGTFGTYASCCAYRPGATFPTLRRLDGLDGRRFA